MKDTTNFFGRSREGNIDSETNVKQREILRGLPRADFRSSYKISVTPNPSRDATVTAKIKIQDGLEVVAYYNLTIRNDRVIPNRVIKMDERVIEEANRFNRYVSNKVEVPLQEPIRPSI